MSKIRSFTYNNGSAIGDNSQLGDLAIGSLGQRYDNNPGGKTWWGSPDEDLTYYIAKDVPTSNWPTPVGNNGSVKFWGFPRAIAGSGPTNGDIQNFLKFVNKISGLSFDDTEYAGEWLYNNGYYTNFPYPVSIWDTITGYNNPPGYLATDGVWGTVYGSTNEELYFFWSQYFGFNEPNSPEVATAEYNGGNGGQDYSYSGSLPPTGSDINIRSTDLVIDNINNYLYTTNEAALNSLNRYNLTNKTITKSTSSYYSSNFFPMLSLDVTNDRLYNIRYNSGFKIEMYTASVLENFGTIEGPSQLASVIGTSINTNNGNLLVLTQDHFLNYNATNITGSIDTSGNKPQYVTSASIGFDLEIVSNPASGIGPDLRYSVAFVPSENSWYVRGNTDTGTYVKGKLIKCTNDNQITTKDLNFITYTPSNGKMPMHIVYDPVRDLLWMFDYPGSLIGVNPHTLNIEVQHSIATFPYSSYIEYNPYLALDETNGVLFTSSKTRGPDQQINVIDLQKIYPI